MKWINGITRKKKRLPDRGNLKSPLFHPSVPVHIWIQAEIRFNDEIDFYIMVQFFDRYRPFDKNYNSRFLH